MHRLDASERELPAELFRASTHHVGLAEAVELARALGRLPRRTILFGIEGGSFEIGDELTAEVALAVERGRRALCERRSPSARKGPDGRPDAEDRRARRGPKGRSRVTRIRVRLGALSHFTPAHFREHFEDASRGTLAEGAEVEAELRTDPTEAERPGRRARVDRHRASRLSLSGTAAEFSRCGLRAAPDALPAGRANTEGEITDLESGDAR